MNDAEYIFNQTASERKRIGRGDWYKKRQGGRQVRLPSDHMTAKEIKERSGPCMSYNMNAPVHWLDFKMWPDDIKTEYLQRLEESYRASTLDISLMMHTSYDNIRLLKQRLGIASKRGGNRPGVDKKAWAEFCGVAPAPDLEPPIEKCPETPEENAQKCPETPSEKVHLNSDSILNLAILLDALKGSGAKLTIEVTL